MAILKSRESLAVKYRPKRLEQLIGQEGIVSLLKGQFKSTTGINQSFLLSGPSGCGKTTLGRIIAHYLNCENFDTVACTPCGTCSYCKDVERNYYGGVDEINFSSERGIDTVRSIIDSTAYASQYNAHVFICDEIQCLTALAQNALLAARAALLRACRRAWMGCAPVQALHLAFSSSLASHLPC
jgi:DNA polymerase-3 subunit gamma/tau